MLKQKRMSEFIVMWRDNKIKMDGTEHICGWSAQHAVDLARQNCIPEDAIVIEVAKVVNNWK